MARKVRIKKRRRSGLMNGRLAVYACIVLPVGVLGVLYYHSPEAQEGRAARARVRLEEIQAQEVSLNRQEAIDLANWRYRTGCVMPWVQNSDAAGYYYEVRALGDGEVVIDYQTGKPLADGQVVCDDRNMTFKIVDGVTADGARSDNTDLVNQRFEDSAKWHPRARRSTVIAPDKNTQN